MADFCTFIEFRKISKIFYLVSIISIWHIMLLLYLVSILYLFKISMSYKKINLTTAIHCCVLFHGGSCLTEALVFWILINRFGQKFTVFVNFRQKVHDIITGENPIQICTTFG